jgi:DNA invertase Pin-like site-specific DNA recombinase
MGGCDDCRAKPHSCRSISPDVHDYQQYSLENQSAAIAEYAVQHRFTVIETYADAARSWLILSGRAGLKKLLQDVVGSPPYKAILVYDISGWGRFQDVDESAHYEFLCKSSEVPICYCAEQFASDGTLTSLVLKSLKRAMAAEYSREWANESTVAKSDSLKWATKWAVPQHSDSAD